MKRRVAYIYLAFAISFIVTIIISILYLEEFSTLQKSNEELNRSYEVKNKILQVQSHLIEAENLQRGFLITEDKSLLVPFNETEKNIIREIEVLKVLTRNDQQQQNIIGKLKQTVSLQYQALYETIDAENSSNLLVFQRNAERGKKLMKDFMVLSTKLDEIESQLFQKRRDQNRWTEIVTSFYLKLILITSILFQLVSFIIMIQAFKRKKVYQSILENKIKELNLSNSEMEQIAFVASHDLQEPLRKIRTFSDKLVKNYGSDLNKDGQKLLDKMMVSSTRMQELLNDFINYTQLVKSTEKPGTVSLARVIDDVRNEFKEMIQSKKGTFTVDRLPHVTGYNHQLHLLFSNLLDNSLKFAKVNTPPNIQVKVLRNVPLEDSPDKKFLLLSFSDNGIGFEKEFAEKIFIIFQRLHSHNSSYHGKGIGLAICKRVMINHDGDITATGVAGVGATFNLYFPESEPL